MPELHAVQAADRSALVSEWDAVRQRGDALLPLDPSLPDAAVRTLLDELRPATFVGIGPDGERSEQRRDGTPVPEGTALVVPTSGSTGSPKGVVLSQRALDASVATSNARLGARDGERWACVLPLWHVAGLSTVLRSRALGRDPALLSGSRLEPGADIDAAHVSLVPTQLLRALDDGVDLAAFRTVLVGGAALAADLADRARQAGANVVVSYGMTETCGGCVYDGRPLDGVEVRVGPEDGRVLLRGPVLFDGYRGRPGSDAPGVDGGADGWWATPDVGELVHGRLRILGRADDVIVTGGEKVSASTVTTALLDHPDVAAAHVLGLPDVEWGERVAALVVPRAGSGLSGDEVERHARSVLPAHAVPRRIAVVPTLPAGPMGKLTRAQAERLLGDA